MALPAALTNVLVQQGNGDVLISWDYQSGATAYAVQRSTDLNSWSTLTPAPTSPQFIDDTGVVGTAYYYRAAGVNGTGTGPYSLPQQAVPTHPGQMTLGQLRLLAQQEADLVGSQFITTAEWNTYINQSYFELYDLMVQKYGNDYFVESVEFTTTNAQDYALPTGANYSGARPFYKLMGIDLGISASANAWLTLKKYEFISRNRYVYPQITTNLLGVGGMRYRLVGQNVQFIPTPSAGQTIRLWYIPRMETLLQDTDIADGVSGWTEYIIIDAAIKAMAKQESDISTLAARKVAIIDRLEAAAENRDAGEPEVISSTRRFSDLWGFGDGGDSDGPIGGV